MVAEIFQFRPKWWIDRQSHPSCHVASMATKTCHRHSSESVFGTNSIMMFCFIILGPMIAGEPAQLRVWWKKCKERLMPITVLTSL